MQKKSLCLFLLAILLTACMTMPIGNTKVPQPSKPVDLNKYLGKWYEIARYENSFEKNCEAVTAEYSLRDDGLINVINSCHKGAVTGPLKLANGKAKIVAGSNDAKLKVSFFGPFFFGDYWVLDHANDYSWSIVGEPSGNYLWVLAREPHLKDKVNADINSKIRHMGYDLNLLRKTSHPD